VSSKVLAPLIGLLVTFGGTLALISPASRLLGRAEAVLTKLLEQAVLWLILGMVVAIVVLWEREPLASLWLQPFRWQSIAWGLLLAAAQIYLAFPLRVWLIRALRLPGFDAGLESVLAFPVWLRVVMVVSAAVVEETLFHGYALTRLGALLGSTWLGALVLVPAFALVHLPAWGRGVVVSLLPSGALAAAFFIWRQDLLAMVVAHAVVDAVGLILSPPVSSIERARPGLEPPGRRPGRRSPR
jgi:membrane protease YdiL (CAAX protease family)